MLKHKIFPALFLAIISVVFFSSKFTEAQEKAEITSIEQLNDSRYIVAVSDSGTPYDAVVKYLPKAKRIYHNGYDGYIAVQSEKADAYAIDRTQVQLAIKNGLKGVKLLPGHLGESINVAVGISRASKINNLKEKVNQFISELRASGTIDDMYSRWAVKGNYDMPDINVPEKSELHLVIGTSGLAIPFSYYVRNKLTGYDIELAKRFAAWLGAELEIRVYDYGGLITAAITGEIDCIMANLHVVPERAEKIDFSDIMYSSETALMIKDKNASYSSSSQKKYTSIKELQEKKIGIATGSIFDKIIRETMPSADVYYFDSGADMVGALTTNKIDAFLADEPVSLMIEKENPKITHINKRPAEYDNAFILPKNSKSENLLNELNEFISKIKADGTLDNLSSKWFGDDESKKILSDYEKLPAVKGVLKIATENDTPPFSYIKDGRLVGYDVEIIIRFCEAYGYKPDMSGMIFAATLTAVSVGKSDVGVGGITITPERQENMNFTESVYTGGALFSVLKNDEQKVSAVKAKYNNLAELDGKPIGVQTGVAEWGDLAKKLFPNSEIVYFNTFADLSAALDSYKIEAFIVDEPVFQLMAANNNRLAMLDERIDEPLDVAYVFAKTEKGKKLCDELNEFIISLKKSGELEKIITKWTGPDEEAKTLPDYKNFPAPNGILSLATEGEYPPFNYYRGTEIAGFEIEIAARFCEAYGYGLKINSMDFNAILPAVALGKFDFGASGISVIEEESENIILSEPYYACRTVIACLKAPTVKPKYNSIAELHGKPIGVQTGASDWVKIVETLLPDSEIIYFNTFADMTVALKTNKIEAFPVDEAVFRLMASNNDTLAKIDEKIDETYDLAFVFPKNENAKKLCDKLSEFIRSLKARGEIERIITKWTGSNENAKTLPDYKSLPAANGTVRLVTDDEYPPFCYIKNNEVVGLEVEIIAKFCEAYGYGLELTSMTFTGILPALFAGKFDLAGGGMSIGDEKDETSYFSEPYYQSRTIMACLKDSQSSVSSSVEDKPSFFDELKGSIDRTFLREDRYKLFIEGIMNTMIITVSAIIFGTILGFLLFMLCRRGNFLANLITNVSIYLIQGTPLVVLLMILYYIIFGDIDIKAIWVSIIAFTLTFGSSFYGMLKFGSGAVDKGQTEAAYALGFTDWQTFFKIILPQAALHFMPSYKAEVSALVKATAIVGYISVQDLTKMGDIVRSRTYEAFFPLISVAVIYFILAGLLNIVTNKIHAGITPSKRKPENILHGIKLTGGKNHD